MKRFAVVPAVLAAVAVCLTLVQPVTALASDKWKAALANADGGATYIAAVSPRVKNVIQCTKPACYATSTSNQTAANCAHDYILPPRAQGTSVGNGTGLMLDGGSVVGSGGITYWSTTVVNNQLGAQQIFEREFDSVGDSVVLAGALDGGDPGCNILQNAVNP